MSNVNQLSLEEMIALVDAMLKDPELLDLYDQGDKVSSSQTKHDVGHAYSVLDTANYIATEVDKLFPNLLSPLARLVVIPAAAFLHDIGRAVSVDDHAGAGTKIAMEYLLRKGFSNKIAGRIAAIVACHRSDDFLKISIEKLKKFPELCIVVIGDKCVGDEDRVRPGPALAIRIARFFGLAKINFWENAEHDRVNFAIKECNFLVDSDDKRTLENAGAFVLKLTYDEKVAPALELLTLYGRRFHSCGRGAKALGFIFRIEVNGTRYAYSDDAMSWQPLHNFHVRLP